MIAIWPRLPILIKLKMKLVPTTTWKSTLIKRTLCYFSVVAIKNVYLVESVIRILSTRPLQVNTNKGTPMIFIELSKDVKTADISLFFYLVEQ